MIRETIMKLCRDYNLPLNENQINALAKEYENNDKDISLVQVEILAKIKRLINGRVFTGNKLNELLGYTIGKTSLNLYIDSSVLNSVIQKIANDFKDNKIAYETYYSYIKNNFVDSLVKSLPLILEYNNLNKIAVNDTFIKDNMKLFDELGFIIKVLTDAELQMLFPEKSNLEREKLRYYAYILRDKYLSIYAN